MSTGSLKWNPAQAAFLITGMGSLGAAFGYTEMAIRALKSYDSRNYYMPNTLMRAIFNSPVDQTADYNITSDNKKINMYIAAYNDLVKRFNKFSIPNFTKQFARQHSLFSHIYSESKEPESQLYIFRPRFIYHYKWDDSVIENRAIVSYAFDTSSIDRMLTCLSEAIGSFEFNPDLQLINSDLQRAYSENQFIHYDYLEDGTSLKPAIPVYSESLKIVLRNANFAEPVLKNDWDVVEKQNELVQWPAKYLGDKLVSVVSEATDPPALTDYLYHDSVPAISDEIHPDNDTSVLMNLFKHSSGYSQFYADHSGSSIYGMSLPFISEYLCCVYIYTLNSTGLMRDVFDSNIFLGMRLDEGQDYEWPYPQMALEPISRYNKFDFLPPIFYILMTRNSSTTMKPDIHIQYDGSWEEFWTNIPSDTVQSIRRTCLNSLYWINDYLPKS